MVFSSATWLIGLVPWGALAVWFILAHRRRARVPHLPLWPREAQAAQRKSRWQRPPLWTALALLALLLAVLGSARPATRWLGARQAGVVTVIVDRGLSMGAGGEGARRNESLARRVEAELRAHAPAGGRVRLVLSPGDGGEASAAPVESTREEWLAKALAAAPTCFASAAQVRESTAQRLAAGDARVIVVSDAELAEDARVVEVSPQRAAENVAVTALAARTRPAGQAMVRLRNDSAMKEAEIEVRAGGKSSIKRVELPPRGEERDYFIDIPVDAQTAEAEVRAIPAAGGPAGGGPVAGGPVGSDEVAADNIAFLARESAWPLVEVRGEAAPAVRRIVEAYGKLQHAGPGSKRVAVVAGDLSALGEGESGIVVAPMRAGGGPTSRSAGAAVEVKNHALAERVDWARALAGAEISKSPPGRGWEAVVTKGGQPAVMARMQPPRQVWVGFASAAFEEMPDFPVFWRNALNWTGEGDDELKGSALAVAGGEWTLVTGGADGMKGALARPGIYRREDGALMAMNVVPAAAGRTDPDDRWRAALAKLDTGDETAMPLSRWVLWGALATALLAAGLWKRAE